MAWTTPTFTEIYDQAVSLWRSMRPSADSTKFSDVWMNAQTISSMVKGLHTHIDAVLARVFPTTTSGTWLDRWLYFVGASDGVSSYGLYKASISSGTDALRVTCTGGTPTVNTTHELTDENGRRYQPNESHAFGGAGDYDFDIVSIDTGAATNLESGSTLTFVSPPAGIQSTATLVDDLDGARDDEENDEGRSRLISRLQSPSLSGNWAQWERWIEETEIGVYEGFVWPGRNNAPYGWGLVDYCGLQAGETGPDRVTSAAQQADIEAKTEAESPALLIKNARYLTVSPQQQYVDITYELGPDANTSDECDWDAENEKRTVTAWASGTKLVTVNAVYATGPQAGDRVIIAGTECTVVLEPGNVAAPVSGSMAKFTISEAPTAWTTLDITADGPGGSGFYVLSGGGLVSTVYDAAVDYLNDLGPARGDNAAPQVGWDDTMRIKWFQATTIQAGDGKIIDVTATINGAGADVAPTYDITATVQLLTATPHATTTGGEVRVWEDK